jgi:hypothetical protein
MKCRVLHILPLILLSFLSCNLGDDRHPVNISKIKMDDLKINRYEQALFDIDKTNLKDELKRLQLSFPMFLEGDLNDSANLKRIYEYITDTMLIAVYNDCMNEYPGLSELEDGLTRAFRHIKYYYPEKNLPDVNTYVSGFDYEYPVQYLDDHLLIALDMYLGADYPRYRKLGLANYILRRFSKDYVVRDCMFALTQDQYDRRQAGPALLDMMLIEGKKLWFAKAMVPDMPETILLDYTDKQLEWAKRGEATVWAFLIENEMLYSSEMQPIQKFIGDGPFTSYFGAESPPKLGAFIGWKIISFYMNRYSDITPEMLMKNYNAQEILNRSEYKPE